MSIPLPTRPPTSAEIEAARQMLERIYQAPSAAPIAGSAAAERAGGILIRGASTALLTVGIWAAMEEPAGLPVLQEQLLLHGPRGFFDQMERMLAEKNGDTQAVRALRTTVMGMLDSGQIHSAGLILGETLAEAQRGGLISRSANPVDLGFDAALRYAQQNPVRTPVQGTATEAPAAAPLAGAYTAAPQPPALSGELQALRDRINGGQYANSNDAFNRGVQALDGLIDQANAQRQRGVRTIDERAVQVASDELGGQRMTSVLSQYVRNAREGGPLPSRTDMDRYMGQVREFNAAVEQRYGRPMFDPATIDRIDRQLGATIDFRDDFGRFLDKTTSGQFANSERAYADGVGQLEALRLRSNEIGTQYGVRGIRQEDYRESLFQLEGRRIHSVEAYLGRELVAGHPVDPQLGASLLQRAETLNANRRAAGGADFFDARTLDGYRNTQAIAEYRQDYRQFNAQVLGGQFANSQETYQQGQRQLTELVDRGNTLLRERGVQPLPQQTLQETEFQLEGRRINSQLSQLQRDANEGRSLDPRATRDLVQAADQLNQNRRDSGSGDLFEPRTMQEYRQLLQKVEQAAAPPEQTPQQQPQPQPQEQPQPQPQDTPNPRTNPESPPEQRPAPPQRDVQREWGEEFGHGDLADQLRREAERQGVSQDDVIDHARRNPGRTTNEILAQARDGQLGVGGTPPGNRPPDGRVAAPGEPDDTPPLDNLTIVRPKPGTLPPAADPNDPLLPFHARPRQERMTPPEPVVHQGQRYDVMGVTASGELQLQREGQVVRNIPSEAMFVRQPDGNLRGRAVTYEGQTWRFQALEAPGGSRAPPSAGSGWSIRTIRTGRPSFPRSAPTRSPCASPATPSSASATCATASSACIRPIRPRPSACRCSRACSSRPASVAANWKVPIVSTSARTASSPPPAACATATKPARRSSRPTSRRATSTCVRRTSPTCSRSMRSPTAKRPCAVARCRPTRPACRCAIPPMARSAAIRSRTSTAASNRSRRSRTSSPATPATSRPARRPA